MTIRNSETTPLVVHNYIPSSSQACLSSTRIAVEGRQAGSEPASGSINRNADAGPEAHRGKNFPLLVWDPGKLEWLGYSDSTDEPIATRRD